jgi:serine/threonine protein kinase
MDSVIALTNRLHQRQLLLHGDIKPANILDCGHGKLRFCESSQFIKSAGSLLNREPTWNYLSPKRLNVGFSVSSKLADDHYALALTIWEIFTKEPPFYQLDFNEVERRIRAGERVDLKRIRDRDVERKVEEYLRKGENW